MKFRRIIFSLSVLAGSMLMGMCRAEETRDFAHYQIILDRSPFGPVPGSKQLSSAQPSFAARFFLVGIVRSNGLEGVVQAIIDDRGGPHRTYFKAEGESIDDVKVTHIEGRYPYSVVVQHGLETATLTFPEAGGEVAQASAAPSGQPPAPPPGGAPQPDANSPMVRRIPFRRPNP